MKRGKKNLSEFIILTNDPSLTGWGYSVVTAAGEVLEADCIKTVPEHKKRRIRQGDDRVRRICEINEILIQVIRKYDVQYILSELPHGSQSATAAIMIGITTGIVQTLADCCGIPVEWYSESDTKKFMLHKMSATKDEMIQAVRAKLTVPWKRVKYKDEAIADALAIFLTARRQSNAIQLLSR